MAGAVPFWEGRLKFVYVNQRVGRFINLGIPLYLGTSPLPLPPALPQAGFWAVLHEIRSDCAQILTVTFLLINGPGKWSLDAVLLRKWRQGGVSERVPTCLDLSAAHC